MQEKKISIIGAGSAASCLARALIRAGLDVCIANRTPQNIPSDLAANACDILQAAKQGDVVFLAVSDDAIQNVCETLVRQKAFKTKSVVAHLSGALSSDILKLAKEQCGCLIGSFHPLETFPKAQAEIKNLTGTFCFIEGDEESVRQLSRLARVIGAIPIEIKPENKTLYHCACVTACNYLTALLDASIELFGAAGIEPDTALKAIEPILKSTVDNNLKLTPSKALTGPIARGDVKTVEKHLQSLGENNISGEILNIYRILGLRAAQISQANSQKLNVIKSLLLLPKQ